MDSRIPETTLVQHRKNLWTIEQGFVRCYLILGEKDAILLDTGAFPCDLLGLIRTVTDLPITVINSHGDGDHTANNEQFPIIYIHPAELPVLRRFRPNTPYQIFPLQDGQRFNLIGRTLEVVFVPGHTPGSICLLDRTYRMLFSGDTVQRDSVFLFGNHRQPRQFPAALKRLMSLTRHFDSIWPSHGPCPVENYTIRELLDCYQDAVAGKLPGKTPEQPLPSDVKVLLYEKNGCSVLM